MRRRRSTLGLSKLCQHGSCLAQVDCLLHYANCCEPAGLTPHFQFISSTCVQFSFLILPLRCYHVSTLYQLGLNIPCLERNRLEPEAWQGFYYRVCIFKNNIEFDCMLYIGSCFGVLVQFVPLNICFFCNPKAAEKHCHGTQQVGMKLFLHV